MLSGATDGHSTRKKPVYFTTVSELIDKELKVSKVDITIRKMKVCTIFYVYTTL